MKQEEEDFEIVVETVKEFFRRRERNWVLLNIFVGIFITLEVAAAVLTIVGSLQ